MRVARDWEVAALLLKTLQGTPRFGSETKPKDWIYMEPAKIGGWSLLGICGTVGRKLSPGTLAAAPESFATSVADVRKSKEDARL